MVTADIIYLRCLKATSYRVMRSGNYRIDRFEEMVIARWHAARISGVEVHAAWCSSFAGKRKSCGGTKITPSKI